MVPAPVLDLVVWSVVLLIFVAMALAGLAIQLRLRNEKRAHIWADREARWTETFLEVLNGVEPHEALQNRVRRGEEKAFVGFLSEFAARVKGEERETIQALARPWLKYIIPDLDRRDAERRARALQTLAELDLPDYEELLAERLNDSAPLVKMVAARRLFEPGNEQYFAAVLDHLDDFDVWNRRYVASLLARGGPGAAVALRGIISDPDRSTAARTASMEALTILHDIPSATQAVDLLGDETDVELRGAALRHLQETGVSAHAEPVRALLDHPRSFMRQFAVEAMGALGEAETDGPRVAELLYDVSPWVRVSAAGALRALGATELLQQAAHTDGPARDAALEVLEAAS